jgi:hypothetical protein
MAGHTFGLTGVKDKKNLLDHSNQKTNRAKIRLDEILLQIPAGRDVVPNRVLKKIGASIVRDLVRAETMKMDNARY